MERHNIAAAIAPNVPRFVEHGRLNSIGRWIFDGCGPKTAGWSSSSGRHCARCVSLTLILCASLTANSHRTMPGVRFRLCSTHDSLSFFALSISLYRPRFVCLRNFSAAINFDTLRFLSLPLKVINFDFFSLAFFVFILVALVAASANAFLRGFSFTQIFVVRELRISNFSNCGSKLSSVYRIF